MRNVNFLDPVGPIEIRSNTYGCGTPLSPLPCLREVFVIRFTSSVQRKLADQLSQILPNKNVGESPVVPAQPGKGRRMLYQSVKQTVDGSRETLARVLSSLPSRARAGGCYTSLLKGRTKALANNWREFRRPTPRGAAFSISYHFNG